jgi:hypothetical protein
MFMRFYQALLLVSFAQYLKNMSESVSRSKPDVMKKMKWMALCMLALPLVTNIKASNCITIQKEKVVVVKAQSVNESSTLIEQIFFPHGI